MPRMTMTQAKKRLNEARAKIKAVYMIPYTPVTTQDLAAIEKIINKCLKRCN